MEVSVNPNEDTEWNDILRKHGVIPEKPPSPTPIIEQAILEARQRAHDTRLEDKQLDELDELEDLEDEEFLNKYRKQRLEELAAISKSSVFGQVFPLQKPDYAREVTEASKQAFVLVHLTTSSSSSSTSRNHEESRLLTEILRELASTFRDVKFCEMQGNMCIEGYPDKNCPSILVYHKSEIVRQMLTLRELKGVNTTIEDLERFLVDVGAVKSSDSRVLHLKRNQTNFKLQNAKRRDLDDDNDDDGDEWD